MLFSHLHVHLYIKVKVCIKVVEWLRVDKKNWILLHQKNRYWFITDLLICLFCSVLVSLRFSYSLFTHLHTHFSVCCRSCHPSPPLFFYLSLSLQPSLHQPLSLPSLRIPFFHVAGKDKDDFTAQDVHFMYHVLREFPAGSLSLSASPLVVGL